MDIKNSRYIFPLFFKVRINMDSGLHGKLQFKYDFKIKLKNHEFKRINN